jgi:hypothetical protein
MMAGIFSALSSANGQARRLSNQRPDVWKYAPMVAAHLAHACLTLLLLDALSPEARDPMGNGLQQGLSGFSLVSTFVVA